jgi:hypothetical protein
VAPQVAEVVVIDEPLGLPKPELGQTHLARLVDAVVLPGRGS